MLGPDHLVVATSYTSLGSVHRVLGDLKQAKECCDIKLGPDHLDVAMCCNSLGLVHRALGDLKQAEYYEHALAIHQRKLCPEHADLGRCYHNLAAVHRDLAYWPGAGKRVS